MKKVFKYLLEITDSNTLFLPVEYQILTVAMQGDELYLWALIDPNTEFLDRVKVRVAGTGHPIEEDIKKYLGTFMLHSGALVFHVFEVE